MRVSLRLSAVFVQSWLTSFSQGRAWLGALQLSHFPMKAGEVYYTVLDCLSSEILLYNHDVLMMSIFLVCSTGTILM